MKHTKLLVVALLVALLACLSVNAMATTTCAHANRTKTYEVASTCAAQGYEIWTCANCGDSIKIDKAPVAHVFGEYVIVQAPTCVANGIEARKCANCSHIDANSNRTIPATGVHDWKVIADRIDETCVSDGAEKLYECSMCKQRKGGEVRKAYGHDFNGVAWITDFEANCVSQGRSHRDCSICNNTLPGGREYQYVPANGNHSWKTVAPQIDATCTTSGVTKVQECEICGAKKGGEVIAAFGHDFNGVAWTTKTPSSCITDGVIERACKVCGQKETQNVPKTGHKWSTSPVIPQKNPGCTTTGCMALYECTVCGAKMGGEQVAALGHKFVQVPMGSSKTVDTARGPVEVKSYAPTCSKAGQLAFICERCGHVNTTTIAATGHNATWMVQVPATATTEGLSVLYCPICGQNIATQVVPAGGTAPSGNVNTAKAASTTKAASTKSSSSKSTAKSSSTTAKSSSSSSSAKSSTTAVKAVEAKAVTLTKDVEQNVTVKNAEGKDVALKIILAGGNIYVDTELAEGEVVALYVDEAAQKAPTEENRLEVAAKTFVELPEAFASAVIAVEPATASDAAVASK